jgi:hypothetical protein
LKNSLVQRNEELLVEIEAFKTHFTKYEAHELVGKATETFQSSLYKQVTALRDERDLLQWHVSS